MKRFSRMAKGDLLFWSAPSQSEPGSRDFDAAVSAAGGTETSPFHVAIVAGVTGGDPPRISIVHAAKKGVIAENFEDYCDRLYNDYARLIVSHCSVEADGVNESVRESAVKFALSKIGCQYNDIFSEECRNSNGAEAYYCCQLIRKCYEHALGRQLFKLQPLNFRGSDGKLIQYWVDYFEERGRPVPEDGYGSNPMSLRKADCVRIIEEITIEKQ